jgi:uncharacterized membrane protein
MTTTKKTKPAKTQNEVVKVGTILEILSTRTYTDVGKLYRDYCEGEQAVPRNHFISTVKQLEREGKVELLGPIVEVHSPKDYLTNLDESLWFYLAVIIAGVTWFLALYDNIYPWEIARWIFGSVEVALLVGYVTLKAIFPAKEEFDSIESTALAVAVSVSVSALIGVLLDISPFGLRELPVLTAITLYSLVVSLVALYSSYNWRRRSVASQPNKEEGVASD